LSLAVSNLRFDGFPDRDALGGGEVLSDLVFRILASQDARHPHEARSDRGLLQYVPDGAQAALTEHQEVLFGDPDGLKKSLGGDAGGQDSQITHVLPVAFSDADLVAGDFDDFLGVVHRAPPVGAGP
jgi:hypothetical protein